MLGKTTTKMRRSAGFPPACRQGCLRYVFIKKTHHMTTPTFAKNRRMLLSTLLFWLWNSALFSDTRVLIIAGKGGTPEYTEKFVNHAQRLQNALVTHHNFSPDRITILSETGSSGSPAQLPCTAQNVEQAFAELAGKMSTDDEFAVILFGHGSAEGAVAKFNLAGPDLRDLDFARLLNGVPAQRQIFVNTTAASAGFVEKLARKDRIVITATRSPEENFATKFPEYFVAAFEKKEEVDLNKDRQISFLEVFDFARDQVVRFYEQANRLRPEHPLLDDDGDGAGSETPRTLTSAALAGGEQTQNAEGALAALTFLASTSSSANLAASAPAAPDHPLQPEKAKLLAEIENLKIQKSTLPVAEYERQLEALFIKLAKLNREIKKAL